MGIKQFDTLEFVDGAIAVGFTREQAEFQARYLDRNFITRDSLQIELKGFESRLQLFQIKLLGIMLTGTTTIISVVQAIYHLIT